MSSIKERAAFQRMEKRIEFLEGIVEALKKDLVNALTKGVYRKGNRVNTVPPTPAFLRELDLTQLSEAAEKAVEPDPQQE